MVTFEEIGTMTETFRQHDYYVALDHRLHCLSRDKSRAYIRDLSTRTSVNMNIS